MSPKTDHWLRILFGIPLALLGVAMVVAESYGKVAARQDPSAWLLIAGIAMTFVGGYLINDTLSTKIIDAVLTRLPLVPWTGGRRSYDPPAPGGAAAPVPTPPPVANADPTIRPAVPPAPVAPPAPPLEGEGG